MKQDEIMLKIENVSKIYKLGEIGGTTLRDTLQRVHAKIHKKEDPTKKIGAKNYNKGETFKALDNISFEVKKGERIGIIGHNGAGKSTLLKLISRVTGPTEGNIYLNGRVASMLEVGTGFHPELTGRENVYMNGAILGMTKKEIDAKMEDIIEFSEVRQFIDTPVKRYSSGMYVKLAFSVAAHLDSEIMIMDEVLAVGDMVFQNKCLQKMRDVSEQDNRTILYVSHNMNTIKKLCDKVVVLSKGKILFVGGVEEGIKLYLNSGGHSPNYVDLSSLPRTKTFANKKIEMKSLKVNTENSVFDVGKSINAKLGMVSFENFENVFLTITLKSAEGIPIGKFALLEPFKVEKDKECFLSFELDISYLAPGNYSLNPVLSLKNESGNIQFLDGINNAYFFEVIGSKKFNYGETWQTIRHGNIIFPCIIRK